MITMSVARIADALQRDFRTMANEFRQTARWFSIVSPRYLPAADRLDQWAATVTNVRPALLVNFHELMAETADRNRHIELLRQFAFDGTTKTADDYVCAYISDRTGGTAQQRHQEQ